VVGSARISVTTAAALNTAADWVNSAARQHNPNENGALDLAAKANDVVGLVPGAGFGARFAGTAAGVFADGVEVISTKPMGISRDVYTPEGRQAIKDSVGWQRGADGNWTKGPYADRWGIDQEKIRDAVDKAEAAQADFDAARAAYERAESRRFSRASWSEPRG
jgi:hypothetical protein